jgi:hypothetical protein
VGVESLREAMKTARKQPKKGEAAETRRDLSWQHASKRFSMNLGDPDCGQRKKSRKGQALKSEELLITGWKSDQLVVPMKEGNASGGKGLKAAQDVLGKHYLYTEREN